MKLLLVFIFIGLAMCQTVNSRPNEPREIEREQAAYQEPQAADEAIDENKKVDKRSYSPWLWPSYGHGWGHGLGHGIILPTYPLYGHGWSGHGLHGGWSLGWPLYSLGHGGWHGGHGGWHSKW